MIRKVIWRFLAPDNSSHVIFDLRECIVGPIDIMTALAREKGIKLIHEIDANVPESLVGDSTRIRQILLNLVSNAVKFSEANSTVTLRADGREQADGRWKLQITVSDTGIGISEEAQSKLFQPFEQADSSITRRYGGTGLGLAISQRLAFIMGGNLSCESAAGEGSSFQLRIPLKPVRKSALRSSTPGALGESEESGGKKKSASIRYEIEKDMAARFPLRILIAEDNRVNQRVITYILKKMGYNSDTVGNGEEAIRTVSRQRYDLILMDLEMPEVGGLEATMVIRQKLPAEHQPFIVALTAHVAEDQANECRKRGMDGYLTKPIKIKDLSQVIREAARRRSEGQQGA